jgi:hypothetical protein
MKTFEPSKTIKELGIDITRKFVVVDGSSVFNEGDILKLERNDDTDCPYFIRITDLKYCDCSLHRLAYAPIKKEFSKDGLEYGDELVYKGDVKNKRYVLDVFEHSLLTYQIETNGIKIGSSIYTFEEAEQLFTITQPDETSEVQEVTMSEVCEKFGKEVKIKK